MPATLTIEANPDWLKRSGVTAEDRDTFAQAKKQGRMRQSYVTAMENCASGLYRIVPEEPETTVKVATRLEDMSNDDLKVMMLQTGIKTTKQMKRAEIISAIRKKLDEVEIVEDGPSEASS